MKQYLTITTQTRQFKAVLAGLLLFCLSPLAALYGQEQTPEEFLEVKAHSLLRPVCEDFSSAQEVEEWILENTWHEESAAPRKRRLIFEDPPPNIEDIEGEGEETE